MAKEIYVKSKSVSVDGNNNVLASIGLGVRELNSEDEYVDYNATFVQPQNLATAFGGITEYGMLVFNEVNSDLSETVTIACVVDGTEVSASSDLSTIVNAELGGVIGGQTESENSEPTQA